MTQKEGRSNGPIFLSQKETGGKGMRKKEGGRTGGVGKKNASSRQEIKRNHLLVEGKKIKLIMKGGGL